MTFDRDEVEFISGLRGREPDNASILMAEIDICLKQLNEKKVEISHKDPEYAINEYGQWIDEIDENLGTLKFYGDLPNVDAALEDAKKRLSQYDRSIFKESKNIKKLLDGKL